MFTLIFIFNGKMKIHNFLDKIIIETNICIYNICLCVCQSFADDNNCKHHLTYVLRLLSLEAKLFI